MTTFQPSSRPSVLCVEALAAPPGGTEAVKLEEQVIIADDGPRPLSTHPLGLLE